MLLRCEHRRRALRGCGYPRRTEGIILSVAIGILLWAIIGLGAGGYERELHSALALILLK